jgi:hypothetical protein
MVKECKIAFLKAVNDLLSIAMEINKKEYE